MIVKQLGQACRRPAVFRRARRQKCDVLLGPETNQRLPEGIATTQQHQAHTHRVSRSEQVDEGKGSFCGFQTGKSNPEADSTTGLNARARPAILPLAFSELQAC
ncbi:hypothetical protein D3C81_2001930 [compost metagenome]